MIGFLHTAAVHRDTFQALVDRHAPGVAAVHVVDEEPLAGARERGPDALVHRQVRAGLDELVARGASLAICTCSSLAGIAERLGRDAGGPLPVPVLRVDRPMAEAAVRAGRRIGVVTTSASSVAPTGELLTECAAAAGLAVELVPATCPDAWDLFTAGDLDGYARRIAATAERLAPAVDVLVLAQASMEPAAARLRHLPVPVLTTPRLAVEAAAERHAAG
ncbi:aspartate/glutamate racemase family protein [Streptomyces sp. DSM 44915]|uniref:Aspartate/glutamate racemase family protein n=1 Tax=Streptomyces chisholmiae TaxID=3075540 RepID=A0ABU2JIL4_9ACTN|nr:aspartate/glutamate racemase family protein [Streptomyces sp. DSM 44915]MDT0264757.1 aspartate/glutamate racemase family protein [Streptomyces sp. DSM 44915]